MARMSFEDYAATVARPSSNGPRISYFSLRNDGDSAIVRFNIHGLSDIAVDSVHRVKTGDGKTRVVSCLRSTPHDPIDACPFCANGEPVAYRLFIPLVEYRQDDKGGVELNPAVWEQGIKTRNSIKGLIEEYGDLTDSLFKITRHGAAGSKETSYSILPANPNVYKSDVFVRDLSAFEDPNYMNRFVMIKTPEEIAEFYQTGDFPHGQNREEGHAEEKVIPSEAPATPSASPLRSSAPIRGSFDSQQPSTPTPGPRRYFY